jgi:hypothetical protein
MLKRTTPETYYALPFWSRANDRQREAGRCAEPLPPMDHGPESPVRSINPTIGQPAAWNPLGNFVHVPRAALTAAVLWQNKPVMIGFADITGKSIVGSGDPFPDRDSVKSGFVNHRIRPRRRRGPTLSSVIERNRQSALLGWLGERV